MADVVGLVPLPPQAWGVEGGVRVIHLAPRCARADLGLVGVRRRVCVVNPGPGRIDGVVYGRLKGRVDRRDACDRDAHYCLETVAFFLRDALMERRVCSVDVL